MMLAWVTLVAGLLPDWALSSLNDVLTDPGFRPGDLTQPLLTLRDLKKGPLRVVPQVDLKKGEVAGEKNIVWLADVLGITRQFFGIPEVVFFSFFSFFFFFFLFLLSLLNSLSSSSFLQLSLERKSFLNFQARMTR